MTEPPVLVFGATGFSGKMIVEQLVARGIRVRAAARSLDKLERLAAELNGVEVVAADVEAPETVVAAAEGAAMLITSVGPYTKLGHVAMEAALAVSVPYVDITGEPAWLRRVFGEYDERARTAGVPLIPAFGYDYVPGNLAGAVALSAAGERAVRIDIAYFLAGSQKRDTSSFSKGTLDSLEASSRERGFAFRDGVLADVEGPRRALDYELDGEQISAIAIGGTEHFTLPRFAPWLREVNVGLGWFQPGSEKPERDRTSEAEGPAASKRAESRARIIAIARAADGSPLATVNVDGPNPYDMSGLLTAWAAEKILGGHRLPAGALGPVDAFGLEELRAGCAEVGLAASEQ